MIGRLLIDECLSPDLVQLAVDAGHVESTCVRNRGLLGRKDWSLFEYLLEHDFILVTLNAQDFRGDGISNPGGLYANVELHPGLICLGSALDASISRQRRLFTHVLARLAELPDLVNQALEVQEGEDDSISLKVYEIPRS
jgi:hypothetical protein